MRGMTEIIVTAPQRPGIYEKIALTKNTKAKRRIPPVSLCLSESYFLWQLGAWGQKLQNVCPQEKGVWLLKIRVHADFKHQVLLRKT
jgi:hypothetical protein